MSYESRFFGLDLILTEWRDGRTQLEAKDFSVLRNALGENVLAGFLRLFVWVDRINSLTVFGWWNIKNLQQDSVAYRRNLQTMIWFVGGALYEAASGVMQLRRAGLRARLTDDTEWIELEAMAKRWASSRHLITLRNRIAFHADEDTIAAGIKRTSDANPRLVVVDQDDETNPSTSYRLGSDMLLAGTGMTQAQLDATIRESSRDHFRFGTLVGIVFYQALNAAGANLPPVDRARLDDVNERLRQEHELKYGPSPGGA